MYLTTRSLIRSLPAVALLGLVGLSTASALVTTPNPSATTTAATNVDAYAATIHGTATPSTTGTTKAWLEYGIDVPAAPKIVYTTKSLATPITTAATPLTALATPLKPSTKYHVRAAAQSGAVIQYGADVTFTTSAPVALAIPTSPSPYQLVTAGQMAPVLLSVVATGSDPVYQWFHGAAPVAGATTATLAISPVTAASGGTYTCKVTNPGTPKGVTSVPAVVQVASITPSADQTVKQSGSFKLTASVTPATPVATFAWSAAAPTLANAGAATGQATATLQVAGAVPAAKNAYTATVTTANGHVTVSVNVTVVPKPVIAATMPILLTVGQPVGLQGAATPAISVHVSNNPTLVSATGLPAGLKLSTDYKNQVFAITGTPTLATGTKPATVTLNATNLAGTATPVTFTITVNPIAASLVGTFNGLISRLTLLPATALGGSATLTVTSTGSYTGSVTVAGATYPVTGQLDTTTTKPTSSLIVKSKTTTLYSFTLTFNPANGEITGTATAGPLATLTLDAWSKTATPALAGTYNFFTQAPATPSAAAPEGASFGTAVVDAKGGVILTVNLADGLGTVVTNHTTLGSTGLVPLYSLLYTNTGSVSSWLTVTPKTTGAYNKIASASLTWNKGSAVPTDHTYAAFDFGVTNANALAVTGSQQLVVAGDVLWAPVAIGGTLSLKDLIQGGGIGAAAQKADFTAPLSVSVSKTFLATVIASTATAPNPNVKLTISNAAGTFTGGFTLTDTVAGRPVTRAVTYQGAFSPADKKGRGFYKLVQLPGTATSSVLTGSVDITTVP